VAGGQGAPGIASSQPWQHRPEVCDAGNPRLFWSKWRPRYLFSGLMHCEVYGGGFSKISTAHFGYCLAEVHTTL
jgi:hypothetical protein